MLHWEKHCQLRRSQGWQCLFRRVTIWYIILPTIYYLIYYTECVHFPVCNDVFFLILMFHFIFSLFFFNERVTVKKLLPAEPCVRAECYPRLIQYNYSLHTWSIIINVIRLKISTKISDTTLKISRLDISTSDSDTTLNMSSLDISTNDSDTTLNFSRLNIDICRLEISITYLSKGEIQSGVL